jgi:hypothetical protein
VDEKVDLMLLKSLLSVLDVPGVCTAIYPSPASLPLSETFHDVLVFLCWDLELPPGLEPPLIWMGRHLNVVTDVELLQR